MRGSADESIHAFRFRHGWGIAGEYLAREIIKLPPVDGVTLHCIGGVDLKPLDPQAWDRINIGYTFFEDDIEVLRHTRRAAAEWDHIVAGSSWCEQHLRIGGIRNTSTILQGIDPANFSPSPPRLDDGRFIVFSGGKFESRKSQDIVMAAMKILMARIPICGSPAPGTITGPFPWPPCRAHATSAIATLKRTAWAFYAGPCRKTAFPWTESSCIPCWITPG
ncbi:hypothetical protein [Geotalea toluenoxydans]|uniref:hypothetical protein n=1 Tax=Geotalea toluenoxydans TaxID=421624 RepID=UPI001FB4F3EA|nr:hypothetical protein [Geotalea toluenoxydans]